MIKMLINGLTGKTADALKAEQSLTEQLVKDSDEKDKLIAALQSKEATLATIKSALDASSAAIMMVNRDFIVTYVNEASLTLFNSNKTEFQKVFPTFDPSKIIGTCIDVFHKNPQHQRQLLATPDRLPFTTEIKVGPLTISLYVTATYDVLGNYIGNVLEWRDISARKKREIEDYDSRCQNEAISRFQGSLEIDLDGNIIAANDTYLQMMGYTSQELMGKHVSLILDPVYAKSEEYVASWKKLVAGEYISGKFKRIGKNGKEVWIHAYLSPIKSPDGKVTKIVSYAIDITEQTIRDADNAGQLSSIDRAYGVVEFSMDSKVTRMNDNFLNMVGYSEQEVLGQSHSRLVESAYANSQEYKAFWDNLRRGEFQAGIFKRIGKGGKEVWMQASYNPIADQQGRFVKVVKFAIDITQQRIADNALANAVLETQEIIEDAKSGNLSRRVPLDGKDGAIAKLCDGVNALMDKMSEIIIQVKEAGDTINTAAGEISSGNVDLSSRTEQQASSLEETAASMEELASTVKQNAENAKQANQLASVASSVATKGGDVVGQVVTTMSDINASAKKIEDIISVIDGIAFQTNILALNAAVEAARAGEQGRGFAVVAGEVRNLAQRSAIAAKEIKELISESASKTALGTTQVEAAGKTMAEIVSSVQRVSDIMSEIAAASVEQSQGIDQVNNAITSMDEVTQQNAALVEQAAAAAESLVDQAVGLMETVGSFKLSNQQSPKLYGVSPQLSIVKKSSRMPLKAEKSVTKIRTLIPGVKGAVDDDWEAF
jgi:methyl-accepting chemotaxis protein